MELSTDRSILPSGDLEKVRGPDGERPTQRPGIMPEEGGLTVTKGDLSGRPEKVHVGGVARKRRAHPRPTRFSPLYLGPTQPQSPAKSFEICNT